MSFDDIVAQMNQSGLGSLDVYVASGSTIPVFLTRIFDDAGAAGTSGFTEPFVQAADVPSQGSGFLIGPTDTAHFRYNIGVRTVNGPVSVTAVVRDASGNVVNEANSVYMKDTFVQTSASDFLGFTLGDDNSIEISFQGGGLIVYGATVDNVTNDPSTQFLDYAAGSQIADAAKRTRDPRSKPLLVAALVALLGIGVGAVLGKR
jgi:hypothetical protein